MIQDEVLRSAFRHYNVTWSLEIVQLNNSLLRHRRVLVSCEPYLVGNGLCDVDCKDPMTFNDGGDCNKTRNSCNISLLANGNCDIECNRARYRWDGGDCCDKQGLQIWTTCLDPASSVRSVLNL